MSVIDPGSRWVAKDGSRTVVVEYSGYPRGDVRNVATGRVFAIRWSTLRAKYRPVEQEVADQ